VKVFVIVCLIAASAVEVKAQFRNERSENSLSYYSTDTASDHIRDSIRMHYSPSLADFGIQFLAGEIGFQIPFWSLGGANLLKGKGIGYGFGAVIGIFTAPIAINFVTDLLSPNRGNTWLGMLGSYLGGLLLTSYLADVFHRPLSPINQLITISVPPVLLGQIFYDLPLWTGPSNPPVEE
jgi:hypothetical protein